MRPPASGMWRLEQNDESGVADAERQSILTRFAEHVSVSTSHDQGIFQGPGPSSAFKKWSGHVVQKCSRINDVWVFPRENFRLTTFLDPMLLHLGLREFLAYKKCKYYKQVPENKICPYFISP